MRRPIMLFLLVVYCCLVVLTTFILALGGGLPAFLTPISTLVGFGFALLHASQRHGWKNALLLLVFVFCVALLFESLGVATGLVYGPYHYTDKLGPKFLGLVPYLIAVAWFMVMYPSLVIAEWLVPEKWSGARRLLAIALVGGVVMTSWDVVMDPLMVAGQHWAWDVKGAYFGVPLQNYWGWWLTVFVTFVLFLLSTRVQSAARSAGRDRLALVAYVFTGYGSVAAALLTGLAGPALGGIFALTPWVLLTWFRMSESG